MNRTAQAPMNNRQSQAAAKDYELDEAGIRERYTANLKGKAYLQVAGRVLLFRIKHRNGNILTTLLNIDEKGALMRAEIFDGEGRQLATGHAFTSSANSGNFAGRYLEKAETSAIGRALAAAGFGTDAAGEDLDEDDQLSDSPVERR